MLNITSVIFSISFLSFSKIQPVAAIFALPLLLFILALALSTADCLTEQRLKTIKSGFFSESLNPRASNWLANLSLSDLFI